MRSGGPQPAQPSGAYTCLPSAGNARLRKCRGNDNKWQYVAGNELIYGVSSLLDRNIFSLEGPKGLACTWGC